MTIAELRAAVTLTVAEAACIMRVAEDVVYEAIRSGEFPVEVIRLGRRIVIPAQPLRKVLGVEDQ